MEPCKSFVSAMWLKAKSQHPENIQMGNASEIGFLSYFE